MQILITATDREIVCEAVLKGNLYDLLTIHTAALTWTEAGALFADPRETQTLTVRSVPEEQGEEVTETVYTGWTALYSIQRSPFFPAPGALMIQLQKPTEG